MFGTSLETDVDTGLCPGCFMRWSVTHVRATLALARPDESSHIDEPLSSLSVEQSSTIVRGYCAVAQRPSSVAAP